MSGLRTRGMALINALIVVAALAAVSLALMARTDAARQRLELRLSADQSALYLDAAQLLARRIIEAASSETVHAGQAWAIPRADEQIDRGTVGWEIDDLQGRFNVNWLMRTDSMGEAARAALPLLARSQGVPADVANRMRSALDPMNLFRESAFGGAAGVSNPPVLPLAMPEGLRLVSGAGGDRLDRLMPFLAALPPETELNINTARPEIIGAFMPSLRPRDLVLIDERKRQQPFEDIFEFLDWSVVAFGEERTLALEGLDLGTGSHWFELRLVARLDSIALRRSVTLHRNQETGQIEIVMSVPEVD